MTDEERMRDIIAEATAQGMKTHAAALSSILRDALRYRWLRQTDNVDYAIDAAIAAADKLDAARGKG